MRVLYVFMNLPIGGAQQVSLTMIKHARNHQIEPVVCCVRSKEQIGEEIEKLGVEVIVLGQSSKAFDWQGVLKLSRLIKERKIDVVHTHLYHPNVYGRIAAIVAGVPAVATEHNVYPRVKLKRRLLNSWLGRRCAKVIAVSDAVRAHVLTRDWLPPQKVVTICNGVDLSPFAGTDGKIEARKTLSIEPDAFVVGTVGRLDNQKGHKFLIEAAKLLRNKIPKLKVVIVGHGSLHDDLVSRIQKEGVGDCVLLAGERRDISHVLKSFDVFAMPSLWEGLPIALLEAMASRLPIITTPVGGIPEFMRDGVNGLMIPVGDTTRLAEAIQKLSGDRGFADKLAQQGLETVTAKFGADTMVAQLKVIYEQAQKERKK